MAHDSSITSSNGALEAVSACPRQQIYRPVKELSFEVANHVKAYLDHQHYEQAYIFLHSLLAAGTSITVPAKPYVGPLATAGQLALASTLVVYPPITTQAISLDARKGSDAALRYLRCVQDTVRGPGLKIIRTALAFSDSRRRATVRSPPVSPTATGSYEIEQLNDKAANAKSLWQCAEDFWHVVGWAFSCSVAHKNRWVRWQLWLDLMLNFLEADWDDCIRNSDPETSERQNFLQESLIWQYICSREPLAGNTRKRIFRAIYAAADPQSLNEFAEVWEKETAGPKSQDATKRHTGIVDFETGDIGDYASEDEDFEMQDAPRSGVKGRRSKKLSKPSDASLPPLEDTFLDDYDAAVQRLGGIDAVNLRQRLIALLCKVSRELPNHFTSVEGLFDTLGTQIRYFPVPLLNVLITTSRLSPTDQVALDVTILTALTSEKYINYTIATPTQDELEEFLLPQRGRTHSLVASAKVSFILEQVFMYMMEQGLLQLTDGLQSAVVAGIDGRSKVKGKKDKGKEEEEDQGAELLINSSQRLRGLLQVLAIATDKTAMRESSRKAKRPRINT